MRALVLSLLMGLTGYASAQSQPTVDGNVILQVSNPSSQTEFHIGETIPLQLAFIGAVIP